MHSNDLVLGIVRAATLIISNTTAVFQFVLEVRIRWGWGQGFVLDSGVYEEPCLHGARRVCSGIVTLEQI